MYARWSTFVVGLGLVFAPLLLGYRGVGATLHDVALGLLACVLALASLDAPVLRFLNLVPAAWLIWSGHNGTEAIAGLAEVVAGALLAASALLPRTRLAARLGGAERNRAGVRA
ncbi:MAG TPA: hypothetical protein VFG59_16370 [Anaeromyxobacter sp.]|nr:hypothetical protein [Anaeromyxobacter sp.]